MDLNEDLRKRWLPSAEQMALANTLLRANYDTERAGKQRERGVYTGHLLVNKEYGWWTEDVELVFLDGVFLTRDAVLEFVHQAGEKHYREHGVKLTGGWAWHPEEGEAAVWEDICTQFPEPDAKPDEEPEKPQAFLVYEDDLAVAFRPVEDRAAAVKWLQENVEDPERFRATYCELFSNGTSWAEHVNPDHIEWLDDGERDCAVCGESFNLAEGGREFDDKAGGPVCVRHASWDMEQNDGSVP